MLSSFVCFGSLEWVVMVVQTESGVFGRECFFGVHVSILRVVKWSV